LNTAGKSFIGLLLSITSWASSTAQAKVASDVPMKTLVNALREWGVGSSPADLVSALTNPNPRVRSLAASELAAEHATQATTPLESALEREADNETRAYLASSLMSLGDPAGRRSLESMCSDSSLSPYVLSQTVRLLGPRGVPDQCRETSLRTFEHAGDAESRLELLQTLVLLYKEASPGMASRILAAVEGRLSDETPGVRLAAANCLAQIRASSSSRTLRSAIAREQDAGVKDGMKQDLTQVEATPPSKQ
jgi:HEAT repeat protein